MASPGSDEAWALFDRALAAQAAGNLSEAQQALNEVFEQHPDHELAPRARRMYEGMQVAIPAPPLRSAAPSLLDEQPSGRARAELAIFQTLHGMALGAEACVLMDCDAIEPILLLPMLGGGLGLTASILLTRDGIRPGEALAINSGLTWGFGNALMFELGRSLGDASAQSMTGIFMAGQAVGVGTGVLINHLTDATEGQIALATSVGLWTGVTAFFTIGAASDFDVSTRALLWTTMALADLGLVAGAMWASQRPPMSRGRTLVIDASAALGALVGTGLPVIGGAESLTAVFAGGVIGVLGGWGLGYWLTDEWDAPETNLSFAVLPSPNGLTATIYGNL
jgi:hypothetical protein